MWKAVLLKERVTPGALVGEINFAHPLLMHDYPLPQMLISLQFSYRVAGFL